MQNDIKKNIKKKNGYVFWITGLSGAGKTSVAKLIKNEIQEIYGQTIIINGDDLRNIFKFQTYTKNERLKLAYSYSNFCEFISRQGINIIFTVVGLFNKIHKYNRKKIQNYIEVYIKTNVRQIIKFKKKKIYKYKKNIVGLDIKAEFPKSADIVVVNNFKKELKQISKIIIKKVRSLKN